MKKDHPNHDDRNEGFDRESLRHLADLIGTSVSGVTPSTDAIDLDEELHINRNMAIASLVIISALFKSDHATREIIKEQIRAEYLRQKSIEWFLFIELVRIYENENEVSFQKFEDIVSRFAQEVWGQPSDEGDQYKLTQIVSFNPTPTQLMRAIELRRLWAKRKGLLDP